jgi:hypothetical protein
MQNVSRSLDQPCLVNGFQAIRFHLKITAHQLQRLAVMPSVQSRHAIGRDNQLEIAHVSLRCRDEDAGFGRQSRDDQSPGTQMLQNRASGVA